MLRPARREGFDNVKMARKGMRRRAALLPLAAAAGIALLACQPATPPRPASTNLATSGNDQHQNLFWARQTLADRTLRVQVGEE